MKTTRIVASAALAGAILLTPTAAFAHPHKAVNAADQAKDGDPVYLANGASHPGFTNGVSCEGAGGSEGNDNSWYGLESAHHGPDAGDPGKGDGCYETTGNVHPKDDVENPAIG